jgi:hypothetical protein
MSYCNLHDDILSNEWFITLTPTHGVIWIHLCVLAASDQGHIPLKNISLIAKKIGARTQDLKRFIPIAGRRLTISCTRADAELLLSCGHADPELDGSWYITDWFQWNKPRDISRDRVRTYRQKKKTCNALHDVTVTECNTQEEEEEKNKRKKREDNPLPPKGESKLFQRISKFELDWNTTLIPLGIKKADLTSETEAAKKRRKNFEKHLKLGFDPDLCIARAAKSELCQGKTGLAWKITDDWLFQTKPGNQINYYRLCNDASFDTVGSLPQAQIPLNVSYSERNNREYTEKLKAKKEEEKNGISSR